jgi:hypothetical protein
VSRSRIEQTIGRDERRSKRRLRTSASGRRQHETE